MANTLKALYKRKAAGASRYTVGFGCALSGSYTNGGAIGVPGETLAFNNASNPNQLSRVKLPQAPAGKLPAASDIRVERQIAGYIAQVEQNASNPTANNFVLRLFNAHDVELPSGAYTSAVTSDTTGIIIEVDLPGKYE